MAKASESFYKGSDGVYLHECDVCLTQSMTSEAVSYCTVCHERLCQSCDKAHKGFRATKNHALLTGSGIPRGSMKTTPTPSIMYCDLHEYKILDVVCRSHGEIVCSMCKMLHHKRCETADLSRCTSQFNAQTTVRAVEKSLLDLKTEFNDLKKSRQTDRSAMKSNLQKCLDDMKKLRKTVDDRFDKLERKFTSEIRGIEQQYSMDVECLVTTVDGVIQQIEHQKNPLEECRKTQDDDVIYVCTNKVTTRLKEYRNILADLQSKTDEVDVFFQPDDVITDILLQLESLGTAVVAKQPRYPSSFPTSVSNMNVLDKRKIDVGSCNVLGCTFMSNGSLVLACGDAGLKLLSEDFRLTSQLTENSLDVSAANDTVVIVTQGNAKQLLRVLVQPAAMYVDRRLKMDRKCVGVDVYRDEIYVTCSDDPGNGEVVVLNMDGEVLRRLGVDNAQYRPKTPEYVKVNGDGSRVFISDCDTNTVTCMNGHGHAMYQYTDGDLAAPSGMYVDGENCILVCGWNSRNVHVIRHDGSMAKILLTVRDGMSYPCCIAYRRSDGCLAVGLAKEAETDHRLVVFRTK